MSELDRRPEARAEEPAPARSDSALNAARHEMRRVMIRHPALYLPLARRRHRHGAICAETQIVIDGFTRSAVTFALVAFQLAQNDTVRTAHHLHALAHLMAGVKRGLPVLVPIRPPEDTVLSAAIREPEASVGQWLRSYVDFYRGLPPLAHGLVIATFDDVTSDFGAVTHRVNQRFGTSFMEFQHSASEVATVFDLIDERASRPPWQPLLGEFLGGMISYDEFKRLTKVDRDAVEMRAIPELRVQRPSAARDELKAELRETYLAPRLERHRRRAEQLYREAAALAT